MTHSRLKLEQLLRRYELTPRRALGQHFVGDPELLTAIARISGAGPDRPVLEIGPGLGSLTLALASTGAAVTAVEADGDLVTILRDVVAGLDVTVVQADAMNVDWEELLASHDDWMLIANLPYNIATPLILDLLRETGRIRSMLVMLQLETAQRLAAKPGDRAIGIPSLLAAYHATVEIVQRVPAAVFVPEPNVESALVRIERHPQRVVDTPLEAIEPLVRTAFGQRRKMLRRSLATMLTTDDFTNASVDPRRRPETLSLEEWAELASTRRLSCKS